MKNILYIIGVLCVLVSCKKQDVLDISINNLQGTWTEQSTNAFKHQLIFNQEVLYFVQRNTIDTLSYQLDQKQNLIYLTLKNKPSAGESNHKILLNTSQKTLTIWGLFASIPENMAGTGFKKE